MSAWHIMYPKVNVVYNRKVNAAQNVAIAETIFNAPPGDHGGAYFKTKLAQFGIEPNRQIPYGAYNWVGCNSPV